MMIQSIATKNFLRYGKIHSSPYYEALGKAAESLGYPEEGTKYLPSAEVLEQEEILAHYSALFGGIDVQIGCCYGRNRRMNALEWHKSSEIVVALTDMILLLGDLRDFKEGSYDSGLLEAFMLSAGESVELYATTLHFCPIGVGDAPFKNVVILPRGTNTPLPAPPEDPLLISKNKWLIIHPAFEAQVKLGRFIGIRGENLQF